MFKSNRKAIIWGGATVFILTLMLLFVFRDDYPKIIACLSALSFGSFLFLPAFGLLYHVLDAKIYHVLVRRTLPAFSFRDAVELTYLGLFGNIAAFIAAFPVQSYYLHRKGADYGVAAGTVTLPYAVFKASVVIYATIMLLSGAWLKGRSEQLLLYILLGYGFLNDFPKIKPGRAAQACGASGLRHSILNPGIFCETARYAVRSSR